MLETLDAEPLFFTPFAKLSPCCGTVPLPCFSPCFWCGDYNTQPRKQQFGTPKSEKKCILWRAASCAVIMRGLNLYFLVLCWFLCHKSDMSKS